MEMIASFTIDHVRLVPGIYVSRKDPVGGSVVTTFDLRMTSPNDEPVMNTAELHTLEHLGAIYLRNHPEFGPKIVYFGPMGCRTGCYLLINGDYDSSDIVDLIIGMCEYIINFEGVVPATQPKECGNCLDHNLGMAKFVCRRYLEVLKNITPDRLVYPVQ